MIRTLARAYAYAFQILVSLVAIGLAWDGFSGEYLRLPMFYAEGSRLNWWLVVCGIVGLTTVLLALTRAARWPLSVWSLIVAVQIFRGWFLSSYYFSSPSGFWWAAGFVLIALLAFAFSLVRPAKDRLPKLGTRWAIGILCSPFVFVGAIILFLFIAFYVPDLPPAEAARLITKAPEFNRYARLVKVDDDIFHYKGSMYEQSQGAFTFRYKDAAPSAPPIKAAADFGYWDSRWHLTEFRYGSRWVDIDNNPTHPTEPRR